MENLKFRRGLFTTSFVRTILAMRLLRQLPALCRILEPLKHNLKPRVRFILSISTHITMAAWTVDYFGPELLTKDGLKPTAEALAGKTRIGIYFSAHWVSSFLSSFHFIICTKLLISRSTRICSLKCPLIRSVL